MNKIVAIASREYFAAVKTKAFVVSVALLPIMLLLMGGMRRATERLDRNEQRSFAVIDHAGIYDDFEAAVAKHNARPDVSHWTLEKAEATADADLQLSDRVRAQSLAGYLTVEPKSIVLHAAGAGDLNFRIFAEQNLNELLEKHRLKDAGYDSAKIEPLLETQPVQAGPLAHRDPTSGKTVFAERPNEVAAIIVPLALVIVMFLVVVVSAIPMMQGVLEEKQFRIAEVLLASVRPFELMSGKLLGMGAISATLITIYFGAGLLISTPYLHNAGGMLSIGLIAWFLLFQVLAVLMFGSMYIAIGASCSDMREAQALLLPLNLLIMLPLLLLSTIIEHPDSLVARVGTFFPTAAPFMAIARIATPPGIAAWEATLAALIVAVTTLLFVWAAGRIFRTGFMAGGSPSWASMLKWILRG